MSPVRPSFSPQPRVFSRALSVSPLDFALTKNGPVTPLDSALTKTPRVWGGPAFAVQASGPADVQTPNCRPFVFSGLQTLFLSLRSFPRSHRLFSTTSELFLQNTRGGIPLREPVRCTEAQKCLPVSPLLATLTHSLWRKSFPCHSNANTRDGGVTVAPVSELALSGSQCRRLPRPGRGGKSLPFKRLPPLCRLFALFSAFVSFVFNGLRPLFSKHPGGGVAPATTEEHRASPVRTADERRVGSRSVPVVSIRHRKN